MMHGGSDVYRFGPFELDSAHRRLLRGREPVLLPDRHADVLLLLASNAGHVATKEALSAGVWRDVAVTDNTIERAIWNVRKTLGGQPDGAPSIETVVRLGWDGGGARYASRWRDRLSCRRPNQSSNQMVQTIAAMPAKNRMALIMTYLPQSPVRSRAPRARW